MIRVGVIGVGSMGENHARLYEASPDATLVGVADADAGRASAVADRYDTTARSTDALLSRADAVSIAVPTDHHAAVVEAAIDRGVHALVEKPFVRDPDRGRELAARAESAGVVVRVGHVERFNPAVETVREAIDDPVAIRADRLGPPVERAGDDGVVLDLMIHDVDVVTTLVDAPITDVTAAATADGAYCSAHLTTADGTVATLTASRIEQKRTRRLTVADGDRLAEADYMDQSVRIHRGAAGSYQPADDGVRYRTERVTDHPYVASAEPLRRELAAFLDDVRGDGPGRVTPQAGIRAVELAHEIRAAAGRES